MCASIYILGRKDFRLSPALVRQREILIFLRERFPKDSFSKCILSGRSAFGSLLSFFFVLILVNLALLLILFMDFKFSWKAPQVETGRM